jgi:hypothetical protein
MLRGKFLLILKKKLSFKNKQFIINKTFTYSYTFVNNNTSPNILWTNLKQHYMQLMQSPKKIEQHTQLIDATYQTIEQDYMQFTFPSIP